MICSSSCHFREVTVLRRGEAVRLSSTEAIVSFSNNVKPAIYKILSTFFEYAFYFVIDIFEHVCYYMINKALVKEAQFCQSIFM